MIPYSSATEERVFNKIYSLRGQKIMLDEDLAELYDIQTRRLNEQVKRNADRFPPDFMFQLTKEEYEYLMSQFATSSWGGRRKLPYAFTEHGILMLSSVLSSPRAIQINIEIMRIFVKIRTLFSEYAELQLEFISIKEIIQQQGQNIDLIFQYLDELIKQKESINSRTSVGFILKGGKGSWIREIMKKFTS